MFGMIKSICFTSIVMLCIVILLFTYLMWDEFVWAAKVKIRKIENLNGVVIEKKIIAVTDSAKEGLGIVFSRLKKAGKVLIGSES